MDPADRGSFRIRLTDHGYITVDQAMTEHTANVTRLFSPLQAQELATLDGLLRKLLQSLS